MDSPSHLLQIDDRIQETKPLHTLCLRLLNEKLKGELEFPNM